MTARREVELEIAVPTTTSEIVTILTLLNLNGIRVLTQNCFTDHGGIRFLITTDHPNKAHQILEEAGYTLVERPVVMVGPAYQWPHFAARVGTGLRRHQIQVLCSYVSTTDEQHTYIVLKTSDDEDALKWLTREMACA